MGKRVLLVTTVEGAEEALRDELGDVDEVRVVVPAVEQSKLQWLANEEDEARAEAHETSVRTAESLPVAAEALGAGDADPVTAIEDALRQFPADEIVVVTRPDEQATWLERGRGEDAEERFVGVPIRHLTLAE